MPPAPASSTILDVVALLGHYEIVEQIGAGGFGVVYKARDRVLGRFVALKILASDAAAHEARAASALNHPHIATVYEVGEQDGASFIAMEYIDGAPLPPGLDRRRALAFAAQIADALDHAHRAGILHRDLKPSNILVTAEDSVKLVDFGLARHIPIPAAENGSTVTTTAAGNDGALLAGTPAYMSPEQAEGLPLDARSDIFAFGAVFYEMVAGQPAFARPTRVATLAAVLDEHPPPVDPKLDRILRRCLAKHPDDRYPSMAAVRADLAALGRRSRAKPAAVTAVAAVALCYPFVREPIDLWRAHRALPEQMQVAILPFHNVGGDSANQVFCDGLAETLASSLTGLEQFHSRLMVVPASEIRSRAVDSPTAARRALGVNLAVTGSVQRAGARVRVTANLVDTRAVRQIASWTTDVAEGRLDTLQDEAVQRISALLNVAHEQREREQLSLGRTADAGAYDLYVQARGALQRYDRQGNIDYAIGLLRKAIRQDARYALAWSGLSEALFRRFRERREVADLDEARTTGLRAVELDERVAPAHVNLGLVYAATGQYDDAIREYRVALRHDSVNADAHRELARALAAQGRIADAEQQYRRAVELRSADWMTLNALGMFYHSQRRSKEAEAAFAKVAASMPDNAIALNNLAIAHETLGEYDRAAAEAERVIAIEPSPTAFKTLGAIRFQQGRYRESAEWHERALAVSGGRSYTILGALADAYRWTPELAARAPETYRRAIEVASKAIATNPRDAGALSCRAQFQAKLGELAAAARDAGEARRLAPSDIGVLESWAVVQELARRRTQALDGLRAALAAGFPAEEILRDPELAGLRQDPRFRSLHIGENHVQSPHRL